MHTRSYTQTNVSVSVSVNSIHIHRERTLTHTHTHTRERLGILFKRACMYVCLLYTNTVYMSGKILSVYCLHLFLSLRSYKTKWLLLAIPLVFSVFGAARKEKFLWFFLSLFVHICFVFFSGFFPCIFRLHLTAILIFSHQKRYDSEAEIDGALK